MICFLYFADFSLFFAFFLDFLFRYHSTFWLIFPYFVLYFFSELPGETRAKPEPVKGINKTNIVYGLFSVLPGSGRGRLFRVRWIPIQKIYFLPGKFATGAIVPRLLNLADLGGFWTLFVLSNVSESQSRKFELRLVEEYAQEVENVAVCRE